MCQFPALKERILRSRKAPIVKDIFGSQLGDSVRPTKYKLLTKESLDRAIEAVDKGTTIRCASEMYGVPRSTLSDYISGKVSMEGRSGALYLTLEEEAELEKFLVQSADIGYPRTRKDILGLVQQILDNKGIGVTVTTGWFERFRQCHPHLVFKTAVPLSHARAMATDTSVLNRYFDMLLACLEENDILDDPCAIFNCDETGLPLNPPSEKVIHLKGSKHPSYICSGDKAQLTVLACTCASGTAMPPFIVLDRKTLNPTFTRGEVPGTLYGLSTNGWMNQDLFHQLFVKHFYNTPQQKDH